MGRNILSRKTPVGSVNMRAYNFFVSGPKFTKFFSLNRGRNAVDQVLFPIFNMSTRSGDIRNQTRKIALNF